MKSKKKKKEIGKAVLSGRIWTLEPAVTANINHLEVTNGPVLLIIEQWMQMDKELMVAPENEGDWNL